VFFQKKERKMSRFQQSVSAILTIGLLCIGLFAQTNNQDRVNDREISSINRQMAVKLDDFRNSLNYEINQGNVNQNDEKQNSFRNFQENFNSQRDSADDVVRVLDAAKNVNDYISRLRISAYPLNDWKAIRNLCDKLSLNYYLTWSWKDGLRENRTPNSNADLSNSGLTGTYQLDVSRSEDINEIANQAINTSTTAQNRDEARQDLIEKLESPEQLTIELQNNQVILASTLTDQITVSTNGSVRTENLPDGSTLNIRANLRGEELVVSTVGGNNDYTVTFTPIDNGQALKVTRRVTTDYLSQTVFAESIFTKTEAVAKFDIYDNPNGNPSNTGGNPPNNYPTNTGNNQPNNSGNNNPPRTTGNTPPVVTQNRTGQFIVPSGTIITGLLENYITTKVSQNNDRFKIRVQGPTQFRGAVVEGYITGINRSGKVTGRSSLTLNFETIIMPNGQTYDFAGFLQSVTDPTGKTVKVDTEGNAKGDDQSKTTAIRSGIGAGVGAIIGAIAGGGKGAAIGAIIGGGAGAGSVIAQGKEDLELKEGTSISIQSSSPNR
jgi:hypothetical protein